MQMEVKDMANQFNEQARSKNIKQRIEFLMMWVLEITRKNESVLCALEPYEGNNI